jgi:hypothetical protein
MKAGFPSAIGPSSFIADRSFWTDEYAVYVYACKACASMLDWDDFRTLYAAIGHKEVRRVIGRDDEQ